MIMIRSRSYIATPPGATIKEQLEDRGMTQKEFAVRMDMSEKHISKLINGDVQLTTDVALRLESVLGIPAQFWNNLESIYREKIAKIKAENDMENDIVLARNYPYSEMAKNGWVVSTKKPVERVKNLRKFFNVVRLDLVKDTLIPNIACRRLSETEKADYALVAWAQKAKAEAKQIKTKKINIDRLKTFFSEIRKMTKESPAVFCPRLIEILAECGIAIVFLPHIGGSFLHGATFFDKDKIVIGLTVRGKDADKFWFSLFHEFGHIVYEHIYQENGTSEADEEIANTFAKNILIPEEDFNKLVKSKCYDERTIRKFADLIEIDPGIVVGRLQKEGIIDYSWHNKLKTQYLIKEN